ncbi:hypothetical protein BY996DRAFT_6881488 [Phakopsora pachyrhizi]|nr:hypothetical protein BY996DRAFT_6881488 [Phakopsora pachyrhizi]
MMASIDQDVIRSRRRLIEKQNELIGFVRLNGLSSSLSSEFDRLLNNSVLSNNGLKVAESVVEKWQNVFRATHLSLVSSNLINQDDQTEESNKRLDTLVRIPKK